MTIWRRVLSGLILALVVAAGISAAALEKLPKPPTWAAAVIAAVAFTAGLTLDSFKKLAADWIERPTRQQGALLAHTRMHDRRGRLHRVQDCSDPEALGVHPAAARESGSSAGRVPPYVQRDAETLVQEAIQTGGLVVIEGASTAGKSRLAYEAMHVYAPKRWLIVPAGPASLLEITKAGVPVRNAVIWLDDVERYFLKGGLDEAILDGLCPRGSSDVVVLATLRSEARRDLTAPGLETTVVDAVKKVMRRARIIPLDRPLSRCERLRAETLRSDDLIAAALDQTTGAGFAEYLAAGPATLQRWESAIRGENLTAGAVISAAVDARRAGYQSPIPRTLLETLHVHYLEPRVRHRSDRPTFKEALDWAVALVQGASGCINPAGNDTYQPFDYLTDYVQRTGDIHDIPAPFWPDLLAQAATSEMLPIGTSAHYADQRRISEEAFRRAADTDDPNAMTNLGILLKELDRRHEAQQCLLRAADAGHPGAMANLALLQISAGRTTAAGEWFARAHEAEEARNRRTHSDDQRRTRR